jgi:hypothetical protein
MVPIALESGVLPRDDASLGRAASDRGGVSRTTQGRATGSALPKHPRVVAKCVGDGPHTA